MRWLGRERTGRTSDSSELNGRSSSVVLDASFSGSEIGNCSPVDREGVAPGIIVVGLLVDSNGEASVPSGEAGLERIFEGEEIGEKKVTIRLEEKSEPEGVRGWKSFSRSERTEKQSSRGGKVECSSA